MTAPRRFYSIDVDLSQPYGYELLTEPRHIIACVRACMGIPTDELERLPPWFFLNRMPAVVAAPQALCAHDGEVKTCSA